MRTENVRNSLEFNFDKILIYPVNADGWLPKTQAERAQNTRMPRYEINNCEDTAADYLNAICIQSECESEWLLFSAKFTCFVHRIEN